MHRWIIHKCSPMNRTLFQVRLLYLTCESYKFPSCQCGVFLFPFPSKLIFLPFRDPSRVLLHPHLPSFQPVRHLSSHLSQSKLFFPNLTLTALCASHIHLPNSSLLLTLGSLPSFIHDLKSSAHDQQGYILPKRLMNCFVSLCCVREGRLG